MKRLLLAFAGLSVIGATAQEARLDLGRSAAESIDHISNSIPLITSNKSSVAIGSAPNVYGAGFGPRTNVWANEDLNTITFIHRSDYSNNGDNSSGSLRFDYSTDGGSTWVSNTGPIYNPSTSNNGYPGAARYPSAAIINEDGNTNPLNAHLGVFASTLASTNGTPNPISWGGAAFGNHKMDNTQTEISVDTTYGHVIVDNAYSDGDYFWGISLHRPNFENETYSDTMVVFKGTMDWTTDSMSTEMIKAHLPIDIAPVEFQSGWDTTKLFGDARIFMADDQLNGYIALVGHDTNISDGFVLHPYLIATSDGGSSWGSPFGPNLNQLVDNRTGDSLVDIFDAMTGGTWTIGNLTMPGAAGFDLSVDANGNPHIFGNVMLGEGTDVNTGNGPAGNFTYFPGPNSNLLVDIYTKDGGLTWICNVVARIFTFDYDWGSLTSTQYVVPEANRPHISMSTDREHLFFSWFETDTSYTSSFDNEFPDWMCRGFNVLGDSLEGPVSTMGGVSGDKSWGNVADWAWENSDGTHQLHMTYAPVVNDLSNFSVLDPIEFKYLGLPYPSFVDIEELELNNFSVSQNYPNPTDALTKIAIEAAAPAQFNLSIVDLTGRLILNEDLGLLNDGRHIHTVDATNFASGVYFYTVESGDYSITKKLIVE